MRVKDFHRDTGYDYDATMYDNRKFKPQKSTAFHPNY
jgi:hypothetical protein